MKRIRHDAQQLRELAERAEIHGISVAEIAAAIGCKSPRQVYRALRGDAVSFGLAIAILAELNARLADVEPLYRPLPAHEIMVVEERETASV